MSDFHESWGRDREEFLAPIREQVGYPDNPSDPEAWPVDRDAMDVAYDYIAALENTIVAERRLRSQGLLR